jgi:hypothetical protein
MTETKQDEHRRLQKRTDQLKAQHADLSRKRTPFDKANHDRHAENLHKHKQELAAHKAREEDPSH